MRRKRDELIEKIRNARQKEIFRQQNEELGHWILEEIKQKLAQNLRDEAHRISFNYGQAMRSATIGYWDDVMKDVRRRRITLEQAQEIIASVLKIRLITPEQAQYQLEHL